MAASREEIQHTRITELLDSGRIKEGIEQMKILSVSFGSPVITDKLNSIEQTYKYMLHYLVEGFADSNRNELLSNIKVQLLHLNDILYRNSILTVSDDVYYSSLRYEQLRKESLEKRLENYMTAHSKSELAISAGGNYELQRESENALSGIFSYIWTMFGAHREDYRKLVDVVKSPDSPEQLKCQIISSLLLGNLKYFDSNALIALLDIYEAEISPRLTARSLVAIFLVISTNTARIKTDLSLKARLETLQDSIMTYPRIREVLMSYLKACDTERINTKMQNELLPEIMKLRPEILNKLKNASEEMDMEALEENPEWEEMLNKNGIGDKLKELTEIQLEGGDVMMMAFSNLKTFPFFNTVANWFLPFSSNYSEVAGSISNGFEGFAQLLDMEGVMCDSDKYSFAFSLSKMPENQRKMISERMQAEMDQLKEVMNEKKSLPGVSEFDAEVTRYLRNIYRFFKLFRRKQDFSDPFSQPVDFMSIPYLSDYLSDDEILRLVGEFYFKRGYYKEAVPILLKLDSNNPSDTSLWEKIGYCYNSIHDLENALIWYRKSELINPDSQWLIKKLALVSRMLGRKDEAVEYYERALANEPDNYKLLISTANCHYEAGNYPAALKHFYHADYLRPQHLPTIRAIAWCELLNGNYEKSISYYKTLLSMPEVTFNDYLNFGHAELLRGNLKESVDLYLKGVKREKDGLERLVASTNEDLQILRSKGVDPVMIQLILDEVRFKS